MKGLAATWLVWLATAAGAAGSGSPDDHLMAGARHFRDGRFDAALVEFRVAERLGAPGAAARWYEGATLVKLGRHEEAVETFAAASAAHPEARDGLLDYYRAIALYEVRLYLSADALLAGIEGGVGPRVAAQVRELRDRIGRALGGEPQRSTIAWYEARASAARLEGRVALGDAFAGEALALETRRRDAQRADGGRAELSPEIRPGEVRRAR